MSIKIISKEILKISCIVFSLVIITQLTNVDAANALTRYFNCTTRVANSESTFSLDDAETCYDKVSKALWTMTGIVIL